MYCTTNILQTCILIYLLRIIKLTLQYLNNYWCAMKYNLFSDVNYRGKSRFFSNTCDILGCWWWIFVKINSLMVNKLDTDSNCHSKMSFVCIANVNNFNKLLLKLDIFKYFVFCFGYIEIVSLNCVFPYDPKV